MTIMSMPRSAYQALYRYLPDSWGDFYDRDSRSSYNMQVNYWISVNLENINKKRILSEVSNEVKQFIVRGGKTQGFGNIDVSEYSILTPKFFNDPDKPDIVSKISPLTFVCNKCYKVTTFYSSSDFLSDPKNKYCKDKGCGGELKQIGLVYACTCGWAGPIYPNRCSQKNHGIKYLKYRPGKEFRFICSKDGSKIEMIRYCPECKNRLTPRNINSGNIFIPFNFTVIELLNNEEESFLIEKDDSAYIAIANWLNKIDDKEYERIVKNSSRVDDDYSIIYKNLFNELIKNGLSEEQAKDIAKNAAQKSSPNAIYNDAVNMIKPLLTGDHLDDYNRKKLAISLAEYKTILNSNVKITIDEGIESALDQNTIFSPDEYLSLFDRFGFKRIEARGNIPMVNCVYGYTRMESDPENLPGEKLTLRALKEESAGIKNIYGIKLNTEGILFELDRKEIINWLIKNKMLDEDIAPDMKDDNELKLWFLNNINLSAINTFSNIDSYKHKYTSCIYKLLHSISHALIKVSEEFTGLDKNSLGEYLFPAVPAFFIYCQNNQGRVLGSLFSAYTSVLDKWLNEAYESMYKCIFDPVCIHRDGACLGCLYINEVSCKHFNKDLNRRYLIGYNDPAIKNNLYGFWED